MNESSLEDLEVALAATPTNAALRLVLVRGWSSLGRHDRAAALATVSPESLPDAAARRALGSALVLAGRAEAALPYLGDAEGASRIERARALLALGRGAEASDTYHRAIEGNPTLEDKALEALLNSREPDAVKNRQGGPRLRLLSNDDTDRVGAQRLLVPEAGPPVKFADVGGLAEVKEEIHRRIVLPFQKPSLFARFKKRIGGGVLLYGPPGCGKTLLARATAGECQAKFLSVAISDVLDMYIGESERKLHAVFEQARASTPTVLFFDELEALAGKRKASRDGHAAKIVSQFLAEMDGFAQNNGGVLILGATNVPWEIDAAFRRPGRFDRVLFVPPPDREARSAILDIHVRERPVAPDVDLAPIVKGTSGFSGADLEHVIETAADFAIAASIDAGAEVPISREHLAKALAQVKPTTVEWLSSARSYARYANEGGQYDEVLAFLSKHGKG